MLRTGIIGMGLITEAGEITHILPGDNIHFYRSKSDDGWEIWTYGFYRGCEVLYFSDGDNKRFLTSNVFSWTLDVINCEKRRFIVEMLCGMFGYNYEEILSSCHLRKYTFKEREKMPMS